MDVLFDIFSYFQDFLTSISSIVPFVVIPLVLMGLVQSGPKVASTVGTYISKIRTQWTNRRYSSIIEQLDKCETEIFFSKEHCRKLNHDAVYIEKSYQRAMYWDRVIDSTFIYSNLWECLENPGSANQTRILEMPSLTIAGVTLQGHSATIIYSPDRIGWQAAKHNPNLAVPLYRSEKPRHALRPAPSHGSTPRLIPLL